MALIKLNNRSSEDNAIHGRRNLIINGAMKVAQRGTSATVGPNGTGEGYTVVDRFQNSLSGSVVSTFSQSTDAPSGFANSAKIEITTADTSLGGTEFWHLRYGFEGQDLQSIAKGTSDAKALTVSFWVKSNKTGTYTVELQDIDNSRRNSLAYTIDSSNTWERKSVTYNPDTTGAFDNDNAQSLRINFWFVAGADFKGGTFYNGTWAAEDNAKRVHSSQVNLGDTVGNEWYITGVQMELGEQATPFEHRSVAEELELCKRYFQKFGGGSTKTIAHVYAPSTAELALMFRFAPEMRATPSVDWSSDTTDLTYRYNANNSQNFDRSNLNSDGSLGQVTPQGGAMWIAGWSHGQSSGDGGEVRVLGVTPEEFLFIQFDSEL